MFHINLLIFNIPLKPFNEDIVNSLAFPVHAETDCFSKNKICKLWTCKLAFPCGNLQWVQIIFLC